MSNLVLVEDDFVRYLFQIIEGLSDDAHDPYHYPVIRVLVRFVPVYGGHVSKADSVAAGVK